MTFRYMLRHLWSRTIIRNMLFSYLSVNLLLLYLLSVVSIRGSTSAITEEVTASSYKVMQQAARGFNFNLEEAKRTLIQFAAHNSVIALMSPSNSINVQERIQHERNIADLSWGVTSLQSLIGDILILGNNGYVNTLDNRKTLQWDYVFREQPWFLKAVSDNPNKGFIALNLHIQDYYVKSNLAKYGRPTFSIAIQVKGYGQQVIGTVIANLDLQKINGMFELSTDQNGENIFMVDKERTVIVHRDPAKIGGKMGFVGINKLYESESGSFVTDIDGKEQLVIFQPTSVEGLRLVSTVPMAEIRAQSDPLRANLAGLLYLCLIVNTLISVVITVRISRPFSRLLYTIDKVGEESLYVVPKNFKYRELNLIGNRFKDLVGRIEQLVKQNYVSQIAVQDARLKALQSQINPHFLFNTLQLLQTEIVCGNTADSNRLVLSLSNLLRYSMRGSEETVELAAELQNAKDYLYIVNKKFDDRIAVEFAEPEPQVLRTQTIRLMLQPLVENAIRHGFDENPRSACIRFQICAVKKGILIAVSDNGAGMSAERRKWLNERMREADSLSENIGMQNVNQRIKLKFGQEYGLRIRSHPGKGTTVYILLPDERIRKEVARDENSDRGRPNLPA
ncbi:MAG TPA: sensor histidine kinase [Paenibacillus sp.]|uniref:cache domain-containing sensor histidine kinase n=1 Tax=Paenibacillus sp. TaxID=58172 RepID=UPI002BE8E5ED|nr:sensor histidine kinase [Paenibacillus sp.]HUC93699.1 sensor histidine kinase [Paenibacillus sp.]